MVAAVSILVMYFNHLLCRERCATMLASALLCFQQRCKVVRFGRVFPQACSPVEPVAIEWRAFALHFGMTTNASVSISPQAHSPITKSDYSPCQSANNGFDASDSTFADDAVLSKV